MSTEILSARVVQAGRLVSHEGMDLFDVVSTLQADLAKSLEKSKSLEENVSVINGRFEQLELKFNSEVQKIMKLYGTLSSKIGDGTKTDAVVENGDLEPEKRRGRRPKASAA